MAYLYLTEQGALLRKTGNRLVVEKRRTVDGEDRREVLLQVPCLKLDGVLLFGNVQFTTQAVVELLDHGIELALLSRSGRLRGQLTPPHPGNLALRFAQTDRCRDEAFCLAFAREVVAAKVESGAALLRRFEANHPGAVEGAVLAALDDARAAVGKASSLESLRGIEGSAAARYFAALPALVPPALRFAGRSRRPPRDPCNALLSFGYVLTGIELRSLLDALGFEPHLGLYHRPDRGRPSLALDLLEEFRAPLVDRSMTKLLNLGVLSAEDFSSSRRTGVRLRREGLKRFFAAWEAELERPIALGEEDGGGEASFRQLFRRQAERLARTLRHGEPYRAFRYPV